MSVDQKWGIFVLGFRIINIIVLQAEKAQQDSCAKFERISETAKTGNIHELFLITLLDILKIFLFNNS